MARLWTCGFELQSVASGVEFTENTYGSPSISTAIKRGGAASLRLNPTNSDYGIDQTIGTTVDTVWVRFYIYIASAPTDANTVIYGSYDSNYGQFDVLYLNTDRSLSYHTYDGSQYAERGTSDPLELDTWYRVEIAADTSGSTWYWSARLDGVEFATGSVVGGAAIDTDGLFFDVFTLDPVTFANGNATADIYIDDIAVNDDSGSNQNSWPGDGMVIHMRVAGAGDNNPTTGTYADIDELTPDDASSYIELDDNSNVGDFTLQSIEDVGISTLDTINLVQVGIRERAETAATESWQLRIKGQASGSVQSSATITHNDITWKTNGDVVYGYQLTAYVNPQDSAAWEPSDLDTVQIGVIAIDASPDIWVSTLWLVVDYSPLPFEERTNTVTAKGNIRKNLSQGLQAKASIKIFGVSRGVTAKAQIHMFVELFDSDTYKDGAETTADWDTISGKLKLAPQT